MRRAALAKTMRKLLGAAAEQCWELTAHEHQLEPIGDWTSWLILGGRGAGKTRAGAEWVRAMVADGGANDNVPRRAIALVGETYADAREVMIEGPSGLCAVAAEKSRPSYEASRRRLVWPNGAVAYAFSAEDPDGLRGYQFDAAWTDETGAPAVDKGANQPNLFVDPKSSESALPYYSSGRRDDLAQRRYLEAQASYWQASEHNPTSTEYGGPMVDPARRYVWCWDARPFPAFPARDDIWGDGGNWEKGHWLNGRLGRAPLDLLLRALAGEAGFSEIDTRGLKAIITGYIVDRPMSPREMIDPLADVFQFDVVETGAGLRFQSRDAETAHLLAAGDLVERREGAFELQLAQESDLPAAFRLGFINEAEDFAPAAVEARDPGAQTLREIGAELPAVMPAAEAEARARSILADAWVMRETLSFTLPPSQLALEPGDAVSLTELGAAKRFRLVEVEEQGERRASLVRVSPEIYDAPVGALTFAAPESLPVYAAPLWALMDLPLFDEEADPAKPWFAAFADPWPGGVALYHVPSGAAAQRAGGAPARAVMGRLTNGLPPAVGAGRWHGAPVAARLAYGALSSRSIEDVLAGANAFAVEAANGGWEIVQFREAALQENGSYRLSGLLRGQAGSEDAAAAGALSDARFVMLNAALSQPVFASHLRAVETDWTAGPEGELPGMENYTSRALTMAQRGLAPLSPVHLRARREGADLRLSWIRRTRLGGDSWEGEVPLSEAREAYRVTIYDGASAVRSVETTSADYLYAAADIAADFSSGLGAVLSFAVVQISDAIGVGVEAKRAVEIS